MKLILVLLTTILLNKTALATGGVGEDPNMEMPTSAQAGSTFTSAVSKGDQPAFCEKCEDNTKARMSNNVGVLTTVTATGSAVVDSSGKPVQTGQ